MGSDSEWSVCWEVKQGFGISVFGQRSDGYSSVVKSSGASIRSLSGYESPVLVGFDYSFGRLLYVWIKYSVCIGVVEISSRLLGL